MFEAAVQGYLVAVSLILAIGAQNAFVLRQGLRREHVGAVVLVCALSDAALIAAGVAGFGAVSALVPWIGEAMRWGGVVFLLVYGSLRFRAALQGGEALKPSEGVTATLAKVLTTCWRKASLATLPLIAICVPLTCICPLCTCLRLGPMILVMFSVQLLGGTTPPTSRRSTTLPAP
jgi:arginine exporter protein ArgO